MLDKENVSNGLCEAIGIIHAYVPKQYWGYGEQACRDAIALLKEQDNCENCAIAIEDRQPIVRCKDCKYGARLERTGMTPMVTCKGEDHELYWFCAYGERKEGR